MGNPWEADLPGTVDELAGRVQRRWSDLADLPWERLGSGWDNDAIRIGPWIFRRPRRAMAIPFLRAEIEVLPQLTSFPLEIPLPERVILPPDAPWPIAGYRAIEGNTACQMEERRTFAEAIGSALRDLHRRPIPSGAPVDPLPKGDLMVVHQRMSRFAEGLAEPLRTRLVERLDALLHTPAWDRPRVLVHGDVYARHLVIRDGRLVGLIDWGDVHQGDPAVDLAVAFTYVPKAERARFFAAYGPVDDATRLRAEFHAVRYAIALTRGIENDPTFARMARWAREAVLGEEV